ncbi:hypothetical protein GF352_03245 [archaeon]|nr:hypothetical protein [archaeon]
MGLFGRKKKKEEEIEEEEVEKMVLGVNPELINKVKEKVRDIHTEKESLRESYEELIQRISAVEAKSNAIESTFNNFKEELMTDFMEQAKQELVRETKELKETISLNRSRMTKIDDELIKLSKEQEELEYMSSFQDDYQLIKFCIYLITNLDSNSQSIIMSILNTIHTICEEMISKGFWETGKDAIITSLYNLKSYWRAKDERVENLINNEIEALKILR